MPAAARRLRLLPAAPRHLHGWPLPWGGQRPAVFHRVRSSCDRAADRKPRAVPFGIRLTCTTIRYSALRSVGAKRATKPCFFFAPRPSNFAQDEGNCASVNFDLFMVFPRPTARITHAAKLESSSNLRSRKPEAGQASTSMGGGRSSTSANFQRLAVRHVGRRLAKPATKMPAEYLPPFAGN